MAIIGLAGGLLGAKVIGLFDIEENIQLAFFIPLIMQWEEMLVQFCNCCTRFSK